MQRILSRALASAAVAAGAFAVPLAQAGVVNGGFESGDFSGWTLSSSDGYAFVTDSLAHSGSYHAAFGDSGAGSSLSQTLATTAGTTYAVSFWLELDDGATPNSFSWSWDGITQAGLADVGAGFGYTQWTAMLTATGASTTLQFNFVNPNSFWLFDDVTVTAAVPEPGSMLLVASALLLLAAARRPHGGSRRGPSHSVDRP
jgi:hypothetical protein